MMNTLKNKKQRKQSDLLINFNNIKTKGNNWCANRKQVKMTEKKHNKGLELYKLRRFQERKKIKGKKYTSKLK